MPRLYVQETGETIAEISEDDVQFLIDCLEEDGLSDQDYYINRETLDVFREQEDCPEALVAHIERAMGDADEIDIAWE